MASILSLKNLLIALTLMFFLVCFTQAVNAEKYQQNKRNNMESLFLSMNWKVGSEKNDNFVGKVSKDQILNLFIELEMGGEHKYWKDLKEMRDEFRDTLETQEDKEMGHLIGEHQVYDLNRDGQYELIVSTNISVVVYYLSVICKMGDTIKVEHFGKPYHLEDINKDGTEEILIHTLLADYTWIFTKHDVIWFDIYLWNGSQFMMGNYQFPAYYKKKSSEYQKLLKKLYDLDPYKEAEKRAREAIKEGRIEEQDYQKKYESQLKRLRIGKEEAIKACQEAIKRAAQYY